MKRALSASLLMALLYSSQVFAKNDPSDCNYFSQFIVAIKKAHDSGQTNAQTVAFAREKAIADRLDATTTNLFVGEAIGFSYDHPEYAGTSEKVHDQAYNNCMAGTLP
jgi:hypothetical protein